MHTVTAPPDQCPVDLIAEYAEHLRRLRRSPLTIKGYTGILRRVDTQTPAGLAAATTDELQEWVFAGNRGDATHSYYITIVSGFTQWAASPRCPLQMDFDASADLPEIAGNPEKPARPATEQEYVDIRTRATGPLLNLYLLAGDAGLRAIEISRIDREHLDEKELRVYGKGGKWRSIPTHARLWERFADRGPGPLAVGPDGRPLTREQVISWGNNTLKRRLGYPHLSMHCFRKRFATALYEECGHDPRVVQEALGHASLGTTQRYIGVNRKRMAEAVAALA